jgi:two-component system, NtrC family, sensor histidine kinase HydH
MSVSPLSRMHKWMEVLLPSVRASRVIPLLCLPVIAVLAFAVWDARSERARLLEDFGERQQELVKEVAADLAEQIREVHRDAEVLMQLVKRARASTGTSASDALPLAFEALATVVQHYRAVALFPREGLPIVATDPAERPELGRESIASGQIAAAQVFATGQRMLEGPWRAADGRYFYTYAVPMSGIETLVLVVEARLLLQPAFRFSGGPVRYFLLDPTRHLWFDCGEGRPCRAAEETTWSAAPERRALKELLQEPSGVGVAPPELAASFGRPIPTAFVAWQTLRAPVVRPWILGVVSSAKAIEARQRSLLRRLMTTTLALAASLGTLAFFIVRHHRQSTALALRLEHAQEIADLRERSEKLLENVPVGLVGVSRDGLVKLTNRFALERLGPIRIGAALADAFGQERASTGEALAATFAAAMQTERVQSVPPGDLHQLPDPERLEVRALPLERPVHDISGLLLVEDLSEVRKLERQLVRAEKLSTVGVLTAGLAHEIGTPLAIIQGRAETLLERVRGQAIGRDLEAIISQIEQIAQVIRNVLDFSRAQPVMVTATDPAEAVQGAIGLLDWRLKGKEVHVRVLKPESVRPIAADPTQLQQVLVNVLINALDACHRGGWITIVLDDASTPELLSIEIGDDGCGIPAEDLHAVFDPFFTTKKRGEGTGLGLPVAASIVRNHHGEISLRSKQGVGTTVTIRWPLAHAFSRNLPKKAAHA